MYVKLYVFQYLPVFRNIFLESVTQNLTPIPVLALNYVHWIYIKASIQAFLRYSFIDEYGQMQLAIGGNMTLIEILT